MTAGALLAGAFLSAFLQVVFDRLAFCDVVDYLKGRQCIEGLLQKLKMELMSADEVLIDAEEKQITNPAVKEWLDELEDAVYVADDLLEEIATEALRCKSETTHESVGSEIVIRYQSLEIEGILQLPRVHYYPSLESLIVRNGAGSLCSLPLQFFPKLKLVKMLDCANLDSLLASEELCTPKLTNTYIYKCKKLKSLPEGMRTLLPSLVTLTLDECAELEAIPKGGFPSNLQHLGISRCDKLFARRAEWGLQSLHSLRQFKIVFEGKEVDSFPEEELLPPTLITLFISDFLHLKSLNVKGFQHLTSLKMLKIWGCTTLQCLPEEGLPASLSCLCISLCPSLEQRCQRENGEDWSKIAHIPYIEIDNQVITSHHMSYESRSASLPR